MLEKLETHNSNFNIMKKTIKILLLIQLGILSTHVIFGMQSFLKDMESNQFYFFENIRYGKIPKGIRPDDHSSDRLLDVYIPKATPPVKGFPVFLYIHGGGFVNGDKQGKTGTQLCSKMVERGYAVISMNYYRTMKYNRGLGVSCTSEMKDGLPASGKFHPILQKAIHNASDDATLVLKWIKENAQKYNFNDEFVAVCGSSAGAMTALHLAYFSKQNVLPIEAVVNFWGGVENPNAVEFPAPPMLIYHGDQDQVINVAYSYALQKRLQELNIPVIFSILEGVGHGKSEYIIRHIDDIDKFLKRWQ